MIVRISDEAERDLEAIGDYIARDNPGRALEFIGELRAKCRALADLPERYPLVERHAARGVRRCSYGSYLIFYIIKADALIVIHILHGARDYGAVLL